MNDKFTVSILVKLEKTMIFFFPSVFVLEIAFLKENIP